MSDRPTQQTAARRASQAIPEQEAVMRARAVLGIEIERLRKKAALWGNDTHGAALMKTDADELESVRRYLVLHDYPSAREDYARG